MFQQAASKFLLIILAMILLVNVSYAVVVDRMITDTSGGHNNAAGVSGMNITTLVPVTFKGVYKNSDTTATRCFVKPGTETLFIHDASVLFNGTFTGNYCDVGNNLIAAGNYWVLTDNYGAVFNHEQMGATFPKTFPEVIFEAGMYLGPGNYYTAWAFNVYGIRVENETIVSTIIFSEPSINSTFVKVGDIVNISMNISTTNPNKYIFATNFTGIWQNETAYASYYDHQNVSVAKAITKQGYQCFKVWANETGGVNNVSDASCFYAYNLNITNYYPAANNQFSDSIIEFTANVSAVNPFHCFLYLNDTIVSSSWNAVTDHYVNFSYDLGSTDNSYKYAIVCNTSYGSYNSSFINFYVDTNAPTLNTTIDGNSSYATFVLNLGVNASDTFLQYAWINGTAWNYSNVSTPRNLTFDYAININSVGLGVKTLNFTICDAPNGTIIHCTNRMNSFTAMGQANISAYDTPTGEPLLNFNFYHDQVYYATATGHTYSWNNLSASTQNISVFYPGFETGNWLITIANGTNFFNFSLYARNSLRIYIYDELNNSAIGKDVYITFLNSSTEFNDSTATGYYFISNLSATIYALTFGSAGYTNRIYSVTIAENSSQRLDVYLSNASSYTTMIVQESGTSILLPGALISMHRFINNSWKAIESKYTDVTGSVVFYYTPLINYKFYVSKTGYNDYVFYLNPITAASYNVPLTKTSAVDYEQAYDKLAIIYAPSYFSPGIATQFNLIISSPNGTLINYGMLLTYPDGSQSANGANAIGGQLSVTINISANATIYDTVKFDYFYTTALSAGQRNFTFYLPITVNSTFINSTFVANRGKDYGLGIFERVILLMAFIIGVVGIAALTGHALIGLVLSIFVMGYCQYMGLVPIWVILPSAIIGFFIIMIRGQGGY
jgi:hypothetical protein